MRRRERKNAASASGDESDHISNISTKYISDGNTALKNVRKNEATRGQQARRGPKSETRSHWHDPIMVVEPGKKPKRWQFKCKYCPMCVSINASDLLRLTHCSHLDSVHYPAVRDAITLMMRTLSRRSEISPLTRKSMQRKSRQQRSNQLLRVPPPPLLTMATLEQVRRSWRICC